MNRNRNGMVAVIIWAALAVILSALPAAAEKTVSVNDPTLPGVFDQPGVAMNFEVAHVAYIGATGTSGPFTLFYAAINGSSDWSNLALNRNTAGFFVIPPVAIDNAAAGNDPYVDARHPQIAVRSSTEMVILFQAKPVASPDPEYVLYLARLTLGDNTVVQQSVKRISGLSGFQEDPSFGLLTSDSTARIAYDGRPSLTTDRFGIYYARVAIDNAAVTGTPGAPLLLTSDACGDGTRPLPSLEIDDLNRSHVSWAANSNSADPSPVCYALVTQTGVADNVVISGTQVLGRSRKWGSTNLLINTHSVITILAVDETLPRTAGPVGMVIIDPDKDDQDGSPVRIGTNTDFLLPPGEAILTDSFNLYRPTAFRDVLGQVHMSGYGSSGTYSVYYAFAQGSSYPYAGFVSNPMPYGLDSIEFPVELPGDYTRAAFGFIDSGGVIGFWSGLDQSTGNRNLLVNAIPTVKAVSVSESGCSASAGGRSGFAKGLLLLLIPAALFGLRRRFRRHVVG